MSSSSSSSSSSLLPPGPKTKIVAVLDLHGVRKQAAISQVTRFLESVASQHSTSSAWVCIVTGTGSHSPHGPVLRNAVQALLDKRKMQYQLGPHNKGSFLVNVHSGIVLYKEETPTCTKIQLVNSLPKTYKLPSSTTRSQLDLVPAASKQYDDFPLPRQVAAADDEWKQAIHNSRQSHARERKLLQKEESLLTQAIQTSLQHQEERGLAQAIAAAQDHTELERALEESRLGHGEQEWILQQQEEELLRQALLESTKLEQQQDDDDEDEILQRILKESAMETTALNSTQDEQEMLQQALQASLERRGDNHEEQQEPIRTAEISADLVEVSNDSTAGHPFTPNGETDEVILRSDGFQAEQQQSADRLTCWHDLLVSPGTVTSTKQEDASNTITSYQKETEKRSDAGKEPSQSPVGDEHIQQESSEPRQEDETRILLETTNEDPCFVEALRVDTDSNDCCQTGKQCDMDGGGEMCLKTGLLETTPSVNNTALLVENSAV